MEELSIHIDDLQVGKVVIRSEAAEAIQAARDADFNISSTKDAQFCAFCDGSCGSHDGRGGVGLVYRRQWLPIQWTTDTEQTSNHSNGDFVKQSWPYARCVGSMVMEGVGVLEALHAANKSITRELRALKAQNSTVNVKVTTDCENILRHIASKLPLKKAVMRQVPPQLIKRIKQEIQMLQSRDVKVILELHWCPRNKVPQLRMADKLAGEAMSTGFGYSNVEGESWSRKIQSDMTLDIEPMVFGGFDQASEAHDGSHPRRKNWRKEKWMARQAANTKKASTGDSDPHPHLPLPPTPVPSGGVWSVVSKTMSTTAMREKL